MFRNQARRNEKDNLLFSLCLQENCKLVVIYIKKSIKSHDRLIEPLYFVYNYSLVTTRKCLTARAARELEPIKARLLLLAPSNTSHVQVLAHSSHFTSSTPTQSYTESERENKVVERAYFDASALERARPTLNFACKFTLFTVYFRNRLKTSKCDDEKTQDPLAL